MHLTKILVPALVSASLATPSLGVETSMQVVIGLVGNAERNVVSYDCGQSELTSVEYVNAAPVFMAFVTVDDVKLPFISTVSADGVRYVSGQYEWWTKGSDATLTDVTAPEGTEPMTCMEHSLTP